MEINMTSQSFVLTHPTLWRRKLATLAMVSAALLSSATLFSTAPTFAQLPAIKPTKVVVPGLEVGRTEQTTFPFRVLNAPLNARYQFSYLYRGVWVAIGTPMALPAAIDDAQTGMKVSTVYFDFAPINSLLTDIRMLMPLQLSVFDSSNNLVTVGKGQARSSTSFRQRFDALNAFYLNRAGQNIVDYFNGGITQGYVRAGGSNFISSYDRQPDEWACNEGEQDYHGNTSQVIYHVTPGGAYGGYANLCINAGGGWFDAGDQGKYSVNGATALWHLFNLIERDLPYLKEYPFNPTSTAAVAQRVFWSNGSFNRIPANPETLVPGSLFVAPSYPVASTELPNIVKEARYEMEWLLRMQAGGEDPDNSQNGYFAHLPIGNQDIDYDESKGYGVKLVTTNSLTYTKDRSGAIVVDSSETSSNLHEPDSNKAVALRKQVIQFSDEAYDIKGMVFHSVHDKDWTPVPTLPVNNHQNRIMEYPTTAATLSLAAVGAQCYRIFENIDPAFAARCLKASDRAFSAAYTNKSTPDYVYFYGEYSNAKINGGPLPSLVKGGGAYADNRINDLIYWAKMERYLTYYKKETKYGGSESPVTRNLLRDMVSQKNLVVGTTPNPAPYISDAFPIQGAPWLLGYNWANNAPLGSFSALTVMPEKFANSTVDVTKSETDTTLVSVPSPAQNLIKYMNKLAPKVSANAWGLPIDSSFIYEWGSNHELANVAILAGFAMDIANSPRGASLPALEPVIKKIPQNVAYHLLGSNGLGVSMVTKQNYGVSATNIHHRTFAKQADASTVATPAGWLVGGPNGQIEQAVLGASRFHIGNDNLGVFNCGLVKSDTPNLGGYNQLYSVLRNCREPAAIGLATLKPNSALCYSDNYWSYHTNEVAINWQASWLWLSRYVHK
jgi:hypothetical protein